MQEDSFFFFFVAKISFEDCQDLLETVSRRNSKRGRRRGNRSEAIFSQIAEAKQLHVNPDRGNTVHRRRKKKVRAPSSGDKHSVEGKAKKFVIEMFIFRFQNSN